MKHMTRQFLVLASAACMFSSCTPATPPSRFYRLAPSAAAHVQAGKKPPSIGIGPIEIAHYLDQPQIVTQQSDYEYRAHEFNRWVEPLRGTIPALLRENLAARLHSDAIFDYPWTSGVARPQYQLGIDILRLHCPADRRCELLAFWELSDLQQGQVITVRESVLSAAAAGPEYSDQAAALSGLLGQLADEMAKAVPSH